MEDLRDGALYSTKQKYLVVILRMLSAMKPDNWQLIPSLFSYVEKVSILLFIIECF